MLRVVIVDDEPLAIRAIQRLLAAHPDVAVAGTADSLARALRLIEAERPDAVFLDIELGTGNGFDVIAGLDPVPGIVFVTAYPEHAVGAFAVEAVDFLVKPVLPDRLAESLRRLARRAPARPRTLELRTPSRTVYAEPAAIAALLAEGDFTRVHLAGQPPLLILRTLGQFERLLPAPPFHRPGRSTIVNLDRVRRVEQQGRTPSRVWIEGLDAPLSLGRAATTRLRAALSRRPGGAP